MMTQTIRSVLLACVLAACGGLDGDQEGASGGDSGSGSGGAFPSPCTLSISTLPLSPVAGPNTQISVVSSLIDIPGAFSFTWTVNHDGAAVDFAPADDDRSIAFAAPDPGVYDIALSLAGAPVACAAATRSLNVANPAGQSEALRLRVLAPQRYAAPPLEIYAQLQGGVLAFDVGVIAMPVGAPANLRVVDGVLGVESYVQLSPAGTPDAIIETFTDVNGAASVALGGGLYNVLVVPSDATTAPRRIAGWTGGPLNVDRGQTYTGVVRDPDNAILAGAQVQLTIDGLPSTVGTTGADGSFAVHALAGGANASVTIDVAPPAVTGLPRLSATSTQLNPASGFQVRYATNVATRDLAGVQLQRGGSPLGGARITVVGQVGAVGTVTAGGTASGTGSVALSATAQASGALPAMRVPAAQLSAVITVDAGDVAVAALDTRTSTPASLDAPAMQLITTAVTDAAGHGLGGAVVDFVPAGALATAAAPAVHAVADPRGAITPRIAAGGHYDLRLHDPSGRAAPLVVADRTTATIATTFALGAPLAVRGQVLFGGMEALAGAAVQLLCNDCTGLDRSRPIAEGQTDAAGRFLVTVPDPGLTGAHAAAAR